MHARDLAVRLMKLGVLPYGLATWDPRPGVIVLIYHRVGGRSRRQIDLPIDQFQWQMEYLRRHHVVVGLDEVVTLVEQGHRPDGDRVVITFDDGYADLYHSAFPILQRLGLPATLYLTTAYVDSGHSFPFEHTLPSHERGCPLTWRQIGEMVRTGLLTIGVHTHSHLDLSRLTLAQIHHELTAANQSLVQHLGVMPIHFAYPWGRNSIQARGIVERLYRTSVIGGTCKNPYATIDLHALRRVPIQRSDGRTFFALKIGSYLRGEDTVRNYVDRWRQAKSNVWGDL